MTSIVIDTNVLVHSHNPENNFFEGSVTLIDRVRDSDCVLCVDEGLNATEARNTSRIWSEYIARVPNGSLAQELLAELLINDRVADFPTSVPRALLQRINQRVRDNTDRVFVKVAHNSNSESLVSHDYVAFPEHVRAEFRRGGIANIVNCEGNLGI